MHGCLPGSVCEDQPEGLRAGQGGPDRTWEVTRRTLGNGQEAGYLLGVMGHGVHLSPREDGEMPGEDPLLGQSRPLTAWADLPSHPVCSLTHSCCTTWPLPAPRPLGLAVLTLLLQLCEECLSCLCLWAGCSLQRRSSSRLPGTK